MPELRLPKLPDRMPVKHTISVMPELEQKLRDYADIYRQSYGEVEAIETLIPYMLDVFLASDRGFVRATRSTTKEHKTEKSGRRLHRKHLAPANTLSDPSTEK